MRSWHEVLVVTGLLAGFFGCAPRSASPREDPGATAATASDPNPHSVEDLDRYRQLLADPDQGIRITVARVLIEHGDLEGKPILLGALHSPDPHHRIDAALALQKLKDPQTVAELRRAAQAERHPLARIVLREVLKQVLRDH